MAEWTPRVPIGTGPSQRPPPQPLSGQGACFPEMEDARVPEELGDFMKRDKTQVDVMF